MYAFGKKHTTSQGNREIPRYFEHVFLKHPIYSVCHTGVFTIFQLLTKQGPEKQQMHTGQKEPALRKRNCSKSSRVAILVKFLACRFFFFFYLHWFRGAHMQYADNSFSMNLDACMSCTKVSANICLQFLLKLSAKSTSLQSKKSLNANQTCPASLQSPTSLKL